MLHSPHPFTVSTDGYAIHDAAGDLVALIPTGPRAAHNAAVLAEAPHAIALLREGRAAASGAPARSWDDWTADVDATIARAERP